MMIPRGKLTSCRSVLVLLFLGLMFLSVNVLLLWNQQGTTQNICVCEPSFNVPNPNIVGQREPRAPTTSELHETINHLEDKSSKDNNTNLKVFNTSFQNETKQKAVNKEENQHQLAVVVPFRNRYEEMMEFVPHIHKFLEKQNVRHQILVINQVDKHRYSPVEHVYVVLLLKAIFVIVWLLAMYAFSHIQSIMQFTFWKCFVYHNNITVHNLLLTSLTTPFLSSCQTDSTVRPY